MITLSRLLPKIRFARPRFAFSAPSAVQLTFAVASLFLAFYVGKFVSRTPIHDEFSNAIYLFAEPQLPWSRYWDQHNEHRIPLPRILYFNAVRLAGNDFRAPAILNVLLLSGAAAFLLGAVRRLRGSFAIADAALPLGLLTVGQYGNLLWSFQVQFISSVALSILAIGIAAAPGIGQSPRRLAGLGLCGILLPLCGMNGIAFAPGIAVGLFVAGITHVRTRSGIVALLASAAILSVTFAYFNGFIDPPHHRNLNGNLKDTAIGTVNLLGASFGPVARWLPPQPYEGVAAFGLLAATLVAATGWLLVRAAVDSERRVHAVVLGGVLIGFLGLAAGIAKGRSGQSNVLDANRYVSLMLPMLAGVYATWMAFGFTRLPKLLAATIAICAVPNAVIGWREAKPATFAAKRVEFDVKAGLPLDFVADRNVALYPGESRYRRDFLHLLHANGAVPFRDAAPLPKLIEEAVPLRIARREGAIEEKGVFITSAEIGTVVFALPRRQHVHGFKLTYTAEEGAVRGLPNMISWAPGGERPIRGDHGTLNQIEAAARPAETLIWVQGETETLRIDFFGKGARLQVHELMMLTPAK